MERSRTVIGDVLEDASRVDAHVVAARLEVDPATGLTDQEAARRLAADGPNELRGKKPVPAWRKILAQFQDPLVYLLLVAVALAGRLGRRGRDGVPVDAVVIAADRGRQRRHRLRAGGPGRGRRGGAGTD